MLEKFFASERILFFKELKAQDLIVTNEQRWKRVEEKIGTIQSAVLFLIPYNAGQKTTNLSVYAQPRDYHLYVKELSVRFERFLISSGESINFMGFTDSSPIDERDAALKAGLGILGKNGLLINPHYGSYVFIGEFFLGSALSPSKAGEIETCCDCGACELACPTKAVLDPIRKNCLSLVSQKKVWTESDKELMAGATCKWGCDLCQVVCPCNQEVEKTPIPYFLSDHVTELSRDDLEDVDGRFSDRAYFWRGKDVLIRNLDL